MILSKTGAGASLPTEGPLCLTPPRRSLLSLANQPPGGSIQVPPPCPLLAFVWIHLSRGRLGEVGSALPQQPPHPTPRPRPPGGASVQQGKTTPVVLQGCSAGKARSLVLMHLSVCPRATRFMTPLPNKPRNATCQGSSCPQAVLSGVPSARLRPQLLNGCCPGPLPAPVPRLGPCVRLLGWGAEPPTGEEAGSTVQPGTSGCSLFLSGRGRGRGPAASGANCPRHGGHKLRMVFTS